MAEIKWIRGIEIKEHSFVSVPACYLLKTKRTEL